jgi:uncharacterized coiled-coil DUF342 family protein
MPGRKRTPVKDTGAAPLESLPSNPIPQPLPLPASEPVAGAAEVPLAPPATPAPRRRRARKQPAAPPTAEPAVLASPLPANLLGEVNEALRAVKDRSVEVQEQLRGMREELAGLIREAADVRKESLSLKQELQEAGEVVAPLHQVRLVRTELQETQREAAEAKERALAVKQEVLASENALAELRQTLQTTQRLREEVQQAGKEVEQVKARADAVGQELRNSEESLQAVRAALDTLRDDLKREFREAGARFLTMGEACKDLEKEIRELHLRFDDVKPTRREPPALDVETPVVVSAPTPAPMADVGAADLMVPAILEPSSAAPPSTPSEGTPTPERRSGPVMAESALPSGAVEERKTPEEGKKQLGVTVNPLGVVVEVLPETPAEKAGLHPGDVVLDVDGKPITSSADLREAVREADRDEVHLTVARGAEKEEVTAHLAEAPAS